MASTNFITECQNGAYKNRLGTFTCEDTVITQSDTLSSFQVTSSIYSNGTIIGSINIKQAQVEILDLVDFTDKDFSLSVGVLFDDDTTEYLEMGKYTCLTPEINETDGKTTISEYDILRKVDDTYVCGISDWEDITLIDVLKDICTSLGLTLKNESFLNSDFAVEGNPFTNGEAYREPLSDIAEIACSWVTIDLDTGELELCWFDDDTIVDTLDKSQYSSLTVNGTYGPVNIVTIKETQIDGENVSLQDDTSIEENGEIELCIKDNYYLDTEDKRQSVIESLFNKLDGFTYTGYELVSYYGKPHINVGDKILIERDDGTYFESYVLDNVFKYDGSFYSELSADLLSEEETTQRNSSQTLKELLSNTQIIVDKVNKQITATVEEVNELSIDTNNTYQEILSQLEGVASEDDIATLTNLVETLQTSTEYAINIAEDIQVNGVSQVVTETGYTFDKDGFRIETTDANTYSELDEAGIKVVDNTTSKGDIMFYSGYVTDDVAEELDSVSQYANQTVSYTKNLIFDQYLESNNGRWEDVEDSTYGSGIGFFIY